MPSTEAPIRRTPLAVLLAIDVACVVGIARLPMRVQLPLVPAGSSVRAPGLIAVTPTQVLFITTGADADSDTVLTRVPFARGAAQRVVLGRDFALNEPVRSLDMFMPTGSRWAWSGHELLIAAPARSLGANHVFVSVIGENGLVAPTHTIDGTRPSAGWARDHFEVAYVTPAPLGESGRVQWVTEVDSHGALSHDRIIEATSVSHGPLAWPNGVRGEGHDAEPGEWMMPDGTIVRLEHAGTDRAQPYVVLASDGGASLRFVRSRVVSGSVLAGDYVRHMEDGNVSVDAHLGASVARLEYTVTRAGRSVRFEADREAALPTTVAVQRDGVLHLIDARGFHARLRADDLAPMDDRVSRVAYVANALGPAWFASALAAMALAHALAWVLERAARGGMKARRFASTAASSMVLLAGAATLSVWWVVRG